jgi:hypothetical protein
MSSYPVSEPNVNINAAIATPTDRVRWGPIIAGLFAALSTLAVLTVLGVAVAGSAYDPGDSARAFGIGAGVWSAISALIAFFIGGCLASRSAAVRSEGSGVLNGAMVWVVAIPLMLYMIMGGIGSLFHAAGSAAATGAQVASNTASGNMNRQDLQDQAQTASARIQATTQQVAGQMQQPENQREAARATAKGAWGTLVSLLLGLAAAAFGGYVGSGMKHDRTRLGHQHDSDRNRGDTARNS